MAREQVLGPNMMKVPKHCLQQALKKQSELAHYTNSVQGRLARGKLAPGQLLVEPAMGPQLCRMSVFGQLVLEREPGRRMALELVQLGLERGQNKTLMLSQPAPEH